MKTYKAAKGARLTDRDAETIGPVLDELASAHGGVLVADRILEAARHPESPLHRFFEWNDSVAAERWRIEQARYLARSIKVVISDGDSGQEVRMLHVVVKDGERGYVPIETIVEDTALLDQLVADAKREQEIWFHRHQQLRKVSHLSTLFDEIERVIIPKREAAE